MINFSLEKFRPSDATETFRVKNSDNVFTKSRKLETKSSWTIKLRSFFKFEKVKEPRLADFNFSLLFIYRSSCTCVLQLWHVFTACLTRLTVGRGPLMVGGPPTLNLLKEPAGSLNLLNLPLLRHCLWCKILSYLHMHCPVLPLFVSYNLAFEHSRPAM